VVKEGAADRDDELPDVTFGSSRNPNRE